MSALTFRNTTFDITDRAGQPWLRLPQIGVALGYAEGYKVQKVFDRHRDEFTDSMTAVVKLPTTGGEQETRIFSPRGCYALGMFARTAVAKEFRVWVLDVLEGKAAAPPTPTFAISERHAAASRENGKKGGRPRKAETVALPGPIITPIEQTHRRWLVSFDLDGKQIATPVPDDAYVIPAEKFAAVLREPGGVPLRLLPGVVAACAERLSELVAHSHAGRSLSTNGCVPPG